MNVTKQHFVDEIACRTGIPKVYVAEALGAFLEALAAKIGQGKHIELRKFGAFKPRMRKARKYKNPRTGAEILIPAGRFMVWKPCAELRMRVNH